MALFIQRNRRSFTGLSRAANDFGVHEGGAHGPLVLFSVGAVPSSLTKRDLTAASQAATGSTDWQAKSAAGTLRLRPFAAIRDEHYRLYLKLDA
jgi:hypothetical protein